MTIRYDQIHLHARREQPNSLAFAKWLDDNGVDYVALWYTDDRDNLHALSTWFEDDDGNKIVFSSSPVLTFENLIWEADDKSDRYSKTNYATSPSGVPADFLELAEKVG